MYRHFDGEEFRTTNLAGIIMKLFPVCGSEDGMTDRDLGFVTQSPASSIRSARLRLVKAGKLRDTGYRFFDADVGRWLKVYALPDVKTSFEQDAVLAVSQPAEFSPPIDTTLVSADRELVPA